nr:protein RRNAD1 isoform X2 [Parasteatoda tepidariorum]
MSCTFNQRDILICNENSVKGIHQQTKLLISFLKEVSYLTEAYILDYFVESLWTKIPSSWHDVIQNSETSDLAMFLKYEESVKSQKPWPLSLLSIRACISSLSLYRKSIISPQAILNFLTQTYKVDPKIPIIQEEFSSDNDWSSSVDEFNSKSCQHKKIPSFCRRHVKPKKQHEIFRIAKVTDIMLSNFNLKNIIDIGSGLGHLSRFLNLTYNFNVTTVEANHHNVSGAVALDKQAFCSLKKLKKETPDTLPHHVKECMKFTSSDACLKKRCIYEKL